MYWQALSSKQPCQFYVFTVLSAPVQIQCSSLWLYCLIAFPPILITGYLLQTPDNSKFFRFPQKGLSYRESTLTKKNITSLLPWVSKTTGLYSTGCFKNSFQFTIGTNFWNTLYSPVVFNTHGKLLKKSERWPKKWSKVKTLEDKLRGGWPFFHKLCEKYYRKSCKYMCNNSTN